MTFLYSIAPLIAFLTACSLVYDTHRLKDRLSGQPLPFMMRIGSVIGTYFIFAGFMTNDLFNFAFGIGMLCYLEYRLIQKRLMLH